MKLRDILAHQLSNDELEQLVRAYDLIGDIAIITVPEALNHRRQLIGQAVLQANGRIKTVVERVAHHGGEFRTAAMRHVCGELRFTTEVREYGVRLALDLGAAYYSPRSGGERQRLVAQVEDAERILVVFSGIGPYPLTLAKYTGAGLIVGVEKNPEAHRLAITNHRLNASPAQVRLLLGDALAVTGELGLVFDRLVMPHPTGGRQFLAALLPYLRPGGMLHFYDMAEQGRFAQSQVFVEQTVLAAGRSIQDAWVHRCGHCSPRIYRVCVDGRIW